jgi:hypothetical protein
MNYLIVGGGLSLLAAMMHLAIIAGGPSWYRFFGAGEKMARMAEAGLIKPTVITLGIAVVLFVWALYAFAGAGMITNLPFQKFILVCITLIYLCRGIVGFYFALYPHGKVSQENSAKFWFWSSSVCLFFALIHAKGLVDPWHVL